MYRKHLKMARGEGEQAEGIRSHFVERVVKLPMVHTAWDYATNTYTQIKEYNKLVNFTLTNAERSVTFVAGQAKPVVMKFEKQIQAVDNLACKGLGTLEEKVPFITKPADEIMTDTTTTVYSRLEGLKKYGSDKVKSVTDFGLQKANAILGKEIMDSLFTTVDGALFITETYLDRFLPPTEEEKKNQKNDVGKSELSRLVDIPSKVLRRSYKALVIRFEYAQERGIELLIYPISMVETYKVYADNAFQYVFQIWESLKKEHTVGKEDGDKSQLEQQLLHLGRLVSRQMAAAHSRSNSPTGSDVYDFEDEPVHDNQVGSVECIKHCDGSSSPAYWNHKNYSSTPADVHLWICILA